MHLICFNHYHDPLFGLSRLVFEGEREYASNLGALSGGGRSGETRVASAADVPADQPQDQQAPAPAANAQQGAERAEVPREDRRRLKGTIDKELERRLNEFKPAIEALLENSTQALGDFVRSHPVFEVGRDKAAAWNLEFCQKVLAKPDAQPREAQCAVYALQYVLNERMKKEHNGAEYPFQQGRTVNLHTRMDGYMGGYTVSVLAGYLNAHKPEADKPRLAFTKLKKDRADRTAKYGEAMVRLRRIFGDPEATLSAEDRAAAEAAERLSQEEQRYLDQYLLALSQRYQENVEERIKADSLNFQELFLKVIAHIQEKEVITGLEHLPRYDIYVPINLNGWLELFSEMEAEGHLTREEFQVLFPQEELEKAAKPYEQSEFVNYPFERTNLQRATGSVEEFYNDRHYRNLWNLEQGHEVDYGLTIVQDFLEQAQYSGPGVRKAYEAYKEALDDYSNKPLNAGQRTALMKKIKEEILPNLKKAIDQQKQAALERIKHWEVAGRLPPDCSPNETSVVRNRLFNALPLLWKGQIMRGKRGSSRAQTWRIPDDLFDVFKNSTRDRAFANYQELLKACKPDALEACQRAVFSGVARTPQEIAEREQWMVNFLNAAIWFRNIDQFREEMDRHFLPPENGERVA